jgi:hypothetical protein
MQPAGTLIAAEIERTLGCFSFVVRRRLKMAKKAKRAARGRKVTLIESEKPPTATARAAMKGKKPVKVNLFVRAPDDVKSKSFVVAARLCGCRRVCQMLVE